MIKLKYSIDTRLWTHSEESHKPERARQKAHVQDILKTPRAIMYWRYQNLRLLLHRPYLLATALRDVPDASLVAEEKVGVGRCRAIAARTISDISSMCGEESLAGWNAVWFMYVMIRRSPSRYFTDVVAGIKQRWCRWSRYFQLLRDPTHRHRAPRILGQTQMENDPALAARASMLT